MHVCCSPTSQTKPNHFKDTLIGGSGSSFVNYEEKRNDMSLTVVLILCFQCDERGDFIIGLQLDQIHKSLMVRDTGVLFESLYICVCSCRKELNCTLMTGI